MPDLPAERFRQTLRRDLLVAMQPAPAWGLKMALAATATASLALAGLLVSFVISPELPQRLNTAWLQAEEMPTSAQPVLPAASPGAVQGAPVQQAVLQQFLEQSNAGVRRDQDFLENWYSSKARPARVKAVHDERVLAIRQFEMANGERVAVLTELGAAAPPRAISTRPAVLTERTY